MSQLNPTNNAYLKTKVLSASREELRLMLLEGAIKFASQGREGLHVKNYEASFNGFSQARNIVMELINSIKPEVDPDLCARVSGLYTFMYTQLVEASFQKDIAKADKVIELLEYERETWVLLMEKIATGDTDTQAAATPNTPPQHCDASADDAGAAVRARRATLSVQA